MVFLCVELQYLKSFSGGHLSERKRAGHVNQKKRLKILGLFGACYGKKHFKKYTEPVKKNTLYSVQRTQDLICYAFINDSLNLQFKVQLRY